MDLTPYFQEAINKKASDLHLVVGNVPLLRLDGILTKINDKIIENNDLKNTIYPLMEKNAIKRFEENLDFDFSHNFFDYRFRINFHHQQGKLGLTARLILNKVPTPEVLNFTDIFYSLSRLRDGLILVTGPTGSGKSTTLAAMVEIINQEKGGHIITVEDPIEYIFKKNKCLIEQREVGQDTTSFASALKYALRQDPNVIMVGEMRDLETISAALTAAETGHLVLSTLHTSTAAETIERIVDVFPAYQQNQILIQLASSLRAIISQQLIPKRGGGRTVAREIVTNNIAVSSLIRANKSAQINSTIQTGVKEGMITMNKSIEELLKKGLIDTETAMMYKRDMMTKVAIN